MISLVTGQYIIDSSTLLLATSLFSLLLQRWNWEHSAPGMPSVLRTTQSVAAMNVFVYLPTMTAPVMCLRVFALKVS